jgi:hypothetical protein
MAELDDVRAQIAQAAQEGNETAVAQLSERYRDLQAQAGELQPVGRGFVAQTGREYQLANRALEMRRAGREDEATQLIRVISRERVARNITRGGRGRGEAALFGANRGIFNLGTLATGAGELVEDTLGGNRNRVTSRERMEDYSAVQDAVRERHPVSAGIGEVGGTIVSAVATPGGVATQGATRGGRVVRAAATGAVEGGIQGGSDAFVRGQDVVEGATRGAQTGAVVGGSLSVLGQAIAPVIRAAGNRLADNQGLRLLAEHVNPQQLNAIVAATRQFQRQFNRIPTLAEAAGMVDSTIAREAGQIVEARVPASAVAQQGAARVRVQAQRDLAESVMPNSSGAPGARSSEGGSNPITSEATNRAMRAIANSGAVARQGNPLHTFLTSPDVANAIRGMPPSIRAAFDDALTVNANGAVRPVTVRMLDDLRQEMGNLAANSGANRAWTEVANEARRFADEISNNAYSRATRQHGQNALREEIANEALRSPAAAQRVAGDLAESAQRARDLSANLGPAEATRIRNAGATVQRALRGVDEFEPRNAISRGEEAANNVGEAARGALLPKTGGAGIAAFIARNVRRLGITPAEAERFARDFTDPSQTRRAIAFLQQRIGQGPATNFMAMLERAGVRPTVERTARVGARLASQGPNTEVRGTQELLGNEQAPAEEPAAEAEQTSFDPASVQLSTEAQGILDQAAELEERDPEAAGELYDVGNRLAELERQMIQAAQAGDEETATMLAQQRRAILNNEM